MVDLGISLGRGILGFLLSILEWGLRCRVTVCRPDEQYWQCGERRASPVSSPVSVISLIVTVTLRRDIPVAVPMAAAVVYLEERKVEGEEKELAPFIT